MKKFLAVLAAVGFVLTANAAMAAVSGSPHHYNTNNTVFGMCEVCHIPHAAQTGSRIWRVARTIDTTTHTWADSTVGALCGTCHNGGVLNSVPNTTGANPWQVGATAYAATSHGRTWTDLTNAVAAGGVGDTAAANANGKPYTTGTNVSVVEPGYIECTSCHDPHVWTTRPFLRAGVNSGITGVCADCHNNRYSATISATADANNMHPVNIAYTDSAVNGGATFRGTPAAALTTAVNAVTGGAGTDTWPLGGKFEGALSVTTVTSTDLIGCGTCHSVHAPAATTIAGEQANHLLAIDNTGATSALCEGCHGNGGVWGATPTSRVGASGDDHPIDVAAGLSAGAPTIDRWYVAATDTTRVERTASANDDWPIGGNDYATPGNIICTSCHSAHNSASNLGRLTRDDYNDSIANGGATDFCAACHANMSPNGHHSNKYNWPPASSNYASPTAGGTGLACTDCHYGGNAGNGAHNGFGFTFLANQNQYSNLCVMCHFGLTHVSAPAPWPTYAQSVDWTSADPAFDNAVLPMPNAHLTTSGGTGQYSTHYIGTFTDDANSINVKRTLWVNGYSKYGDTLGQSVADGTGTLIICESCHSVRYNADLSSSSSGYNINLLLQNYADDSDGLAASRAVGSGFCVACHNQDYTNALGVNNSAGTVADTSLENRSIAPANMHPMTAWSITKAQDTGRATITLITGGTSYATAATGISAGGRIATGNGYVSYPGTDAMDCDSCHRPHRANANITHDETAAAGSGNARPVIVEGGTAADNTFDTLCTACHGY